MKNSLHTLITKRENQVNDEKETGFVFASCVPGGLSCRLWRKGTETGKDKGCGIYRTGGKPGAGGAAGENEGKTEGTFSDDLCNGWIFVYCQGIWCPGYQWLQYPGAGAV